jgi:hypothetical protein
VADSNNAGAIRLCWQYFGEGHRRRRATFKSLPITRRRRNQTGCGYGLFPGDVLPCVYSAIGDLTSAIPGRSVGHRRVHASVVASCAADVAVWGTNPASPPGTPFLADKPNRYLLGPYRAQPSPENGTGIQSRLGDTVVYPSERHVVI